MEAALGMSDDDGNSKRIENKEKLANEKRKRGDDKRRFSLEVVEFRGGSGKNSYEERSDIFWYNINQLTARNSPEMSKEQQEWIQCYNKWVHEPKGEHFENYPIAPPKGPELGDPVARARVKFKDGEPFNPYLVRVAEMAIQFYNINHEGSNFEVVEILSANEFLHIYWWVHINFKAKPKNASAGGGGDDDDDDDDDDERSFFAEHFCDDFNCTYLGRRDKITEGVISTCCLIEEDSSSDMNCSFCSASPEVLHPIVDGFILDPEINYKIQEIVEVTHEEPLQKLGVRLPKGVLKRLTLLTNHFKVSISRTDVHFHHYSVSITYEDGTPVHTKGIGRKILDKVQQLYGADLENKDFAYDGEKSLFTIGPLPQAKLEFKVVLEDLSSNRDVKTGSAPAEGSDQKRLRRQPRSKTYLVAINIAAKIPISAINDAFCGKESEHCQEAVRVLDVILRQNAAKKGCLLVRQSFFHNHEVDFYSLTGGAFGCPGFHSSFRATQGGLSLNMDVSTTVIVRPGPVISYLLMNQKLQQLNMINWDKAKRTLKGLRIKATNTNMEYKITGLSDQICGVQKFSMKQKTGSNEGKEVEITVFEYFVNHRKILLHYSRDYPCINVGKPKRPVFIPIELCCLVSLQRYPKALSTQQSNHLVEGSRRKPWERMRALTKALNNCKYNEDTLFRSAGISVAGEFMRVEGRVLAPPKLRVGHDKEFVPRNGRWNFNNKELVKPVIVHQWAVVNFSPRRNINYVFRDLARCGLKMGIFLSPSFVIIEEDPSFQLSPARTRVEQMIAMVVQKYPLGLPQFIFCVLPNKNSDIYGPWKKKTLTDFGMITQCMALDGPFDDQRLTNLLLKINVKLGGLNTKLKLEHTLSMPMVSEVATMILGMDVSHSSPGRPDVPSIAAVVGLRKWPLISRYRAAVRTQSPKLEMIDSLFQKVTDTKDTGIFIELLMEFYRSSGQRKPEQIIIFRDGVSEGQFNQVLNIELEQIIQACKFKDPIWCPKFMVVVAQKRHNTKFFQINSAENVPPGTVVDNGICGGRNNDFYMCAHNGMIGTTRPKHYHVLYDDIGFSPDDLQELVHSLSYVYQRSTTAISVVAPIRYAHLAARQISQFIKFDEVSERSSSHDGEVNAVPELPRLHEMVDLAVSRKISHLFTFEEVSGWSSSDDGEVNAVPELPRLHEAVENSMFFC